MKKKPAKNSMYSTQTGDYILAALIIILSALPALASDFFSSGIASEAMIYKNNKLLYTVALSKAKTIQIDKMTVEVKDGKIAVTGSDCPQKICVHTGRISKSPEKIICIPNKVLIEIKKPGRDKSGIDIISY